MAARFPWNVTPQEIRSLPSPGSKVGILWVFKFSVLCKSTFLWGLPNMGFEMFVDWCCVLAESIVNLQMYLYQGLKTSKPHNKRLESYECLWSNPNKTTIFMVVALSIVSMPSPQSLINACDLTGNIVVSFTMVGLSQMSFNTASIRDIFIT